MDLNLLKQVNRLWRNIYPYLASQIVESYQRDFGTVLELGPFSGGISVELTKRFQSVEITIGDRSSQVLDYFAEELGTQGLSGQVKLRKTAYNPLVFEDAAFDLVICRGAFFFLDENGDLFKEIFRVLKDKGMAFVGGGYGKDTPERLISEIADESRELNDKLGRKRVTVQELKDILGRSCLDDQCRIVQEGGLWVILEKGIRR